MEHDSHGAQGAWTAFTRLQQGIDELDPMNRVEDRERRDALRDVEARRLEGARSTTGRVERVSLP